MKSTSLMDLVNKQEEINQKRAINNFIEMLDEEFVLGKVFLKYLEFLEREKGEDYQDWVFYELLQNDGPPTKKLKEFDISRQMKGQGMYLHKHTYIEVDYVLKGYCEYHIANDNQLIVRLEEKQLCIVNQSIVHGIDIPDEDSIVIKCMIPFRYLDIREFSDFDDENPVILLLKQSLDEAMVKPGYIIYSIKEFQLFEDIIYDLFFEFIEREGGWRQKIKNRISDLFLMLLRDQPLKSYDFESIHKDELNITKVLEYIRCHYQDVTLQSLSRDLHFHQNYISRKIKDTISMSFQEFLLDVRMKEAERLLSETEMTVKDISNQLGYKKPSFLYKYFKAKHGITPKKFREYKKCF